MHMITPLRVAKVTVLVFGCVLLLAACSGSYSGGHASRPVPDALQRNYNSGNQD